MSNKYVPIVVLLLCAAAVAPTAVGATGASQDRVTLTVTVVDRGGDRVSGATLTAAWAGGETTETTRSNGQALLDVPEGASVSLDVEDGEYVRNVPKTVAAGEGGAVTLDVARRGSATVRAETADGDALPGARVVVSRDGTVVASGETSDSGGFYAETLERGDYDVEVVKPGYYAVETSLSIQSSFTIKPVALEAGEVTARFRVVDDHFAEPRPVAGATVKVGSLGTFNTSDDGTRAVSVPVNAEFEVRVTEDGYETTTGVVTVGETDSTSTLAVRRTPALTVEATNTQVVVNQTVELSVTDEYGDAVGNATLRLDGEAVGTTGADGSLRIPIYVPGAHDVTAAKAGVTSDPVVVEGVETARDTTERTTTVATATPDPTTAAPATTDVAQSSGFGPGFGVVAGVVALLAAVGLLARRR
jgi:PGF-CTERM protein